MVATTVDTRPTMVDTITSAAVMVEERFHEVDRMAEGPSHAVVRTAAGLFLAVDPMVVADSRSISVDSPKKTWMKKCSSALRADCAEPSARSAELHLVPSYTLVLEVPLTCEDHRDTMFVASGNNFVVLS